MASSVQGGRGDVVAAGTGGETVCAGRDVEVDFMLRPGGLRLEMLFSLLLFFLCNNKRGSS